MTVTGASLQDGTFTDFSTSYLAPVSGQSIQVRLSHILLGSDQVQVGYYDNVRLTSQPEPVPAPPPDAAEEGAISYGEGCLTQWQWTAITTLLTTTTVEAAAKAAGVSPSTLHRWMKEEPFQDEWRRARPNILDTATMKLRQAADDAVETLKRNLSCGNANAEIRAASTILEIAYRSAELEDLAARIESLEGILEEKEGEQKGRQRW